MGGASPKSLNMANRKGAAMISLARAREWGHWWFLILPVIIEIVSPLDHSDIEHSNRNIGRARQAGRKVFQFFWLQSGNKAIRLSGPRRHAAVKFQDDRVMCKSIDGSHGCLGILSASIGGFSNLQVHSPKQMHVRGDNGLRFFADCAAKKWPLRGSKSNDLRQKKYLWRTEG
jgi:hypothetical protein